MSDARRRRGSAARGAPAFHLDLAYADAGSWLVLGWVVRRPTDEPDVHAVVRDSRVGPVATFQRQDVIEYFAHTGSAVVGRFDIAYSFIFCFEAPGGEPPTLRLQGHTHALSDTAPPSDADLSFLRRYLAALGELPASPALEAARARCQALLMRRGRALAGRAADAEPVEAISLPMLLATCSPEGEVFQHPGDADGPLALLAIHQAGSFLSHAHHAMLAALGARGYRTIIVNSSPDAEAGRQELADGRCVGLVRRPDHGRDVASWLLTLALLGSRIETGNHVLCCNDSFLGPFDDLSTILQHREKSGADLWALTDSWERGWHVQSSFFALSRRALQGQAFRHFRESYAYPDERDAVVTQGEIGLSRALVRDRSLAIAVVAPYSRLARLYLDGAATTLRHLRALPEYAGVPDGEGPLASTHRLLADLRRGVPRNPQHVFWRLLLEHHRIPFVKRELLNANPGGMPDHWQILPAIADTFGAKHAARVEEDMRAAATRAPAA